MIDLSKIAASSYTSELGDLDDVTEVLNVAGFTVGVSSTIFQTITVPIPTPQALANVRLNFNGITYSNFGNYWWLVPQSVVLLDSAGHPFSIEPRYQRNTNLLTINVGYRGGSAGGIVPAHTLTAIVHFYELPF